MAIKTWKHRRPWRLLIVLGLFMAPFLLRGWIYRQLITYRSVGQRQGYTVHDEKLAMYLGQSIDGLAEPDIQELIHLGLSLTSQQLSFTADNNANDPNRLIHSKTAHCVGYAAFLPPPAIIYLKNSTFRIPGQQNSKSGSCISSKKISTNIFIRRFSKTTILLPLNIGKPAKLLQLILLLAIISG